MEKVSKLCCSQEEMCWKCEADGQSPDVGKLDRSSGLYGGESLLLRAAAQCLLGREWRRGGTFHQK